MADSKSLYSDASREYVNVDMQEQAQAQRWYNKSKVREARHKKKWESTPVDINEIVERFAPGAKGVKDKIKYLYRGERYNVVADMASGYLRIYDTTIKEYVQLDGTPGNDDETHFIIKKREDM